MGVRQSRGAVDVARARESETSRRDVRRARVASSAREGDGARGEGSNSARAVPDHSNDRADDDDDDDDDDAEEDASLEHAPTVFIGPARVAPVSAVSRRHGVPGVRARRADDVLRARKRAERLGGANEPNAEIEDAIQSLPVLCRRGLTMRKSSSGAAEWVWRDGRVFVERRVRIRVREGHIRRDDDRAEEVLSSVLERERRSSPEGGRLVEIIAAPWCVRMRTRRTRRRVNGARWRATSRLRRRRPPSVE